MMQKTISEQQNVGQIDDNLQVSSQNLSKDAINKNIAVTISNDKMSAYIDLSPPSEGNKYNINNVIETLNYYRVIKGIDNVAIQNAIDEEKYNVGILIASGQQPVHGEEGFFEFLFNTEIDGKPKELSDGSVDYLSLNLIEIVKGGDTIAKYTPAKKGIDGYMVTGQVIVARNGKELPRLKGKGFTILEDERTYVSDFDGKVEYKNSRLVVTGVLEIPGDVDVSTGNIDFPGDVVVYGNVLSGMSIKAIGNVTINQHVEAASITAGKDVIIKNGVQGNGKGSIVAGGNVFAKFFELCDVKAKGNINTNAIMNSNVSSSSEVIVSGKFGIIVGGSIHAVKSIKATTIGNLSEVKTILSVGISDEETERLFTINEGIKNLEVEIEKIDKGLESIEAAVRRGNSNQLLNDKRIQMSRSKVTLNVELNNKNAEKNEMLRLYELSKDANIEILKTVHVGAKIIINSSVYYVRSSLLKTKFMRSEGEITVI